MRRRLGPGPMVVAALAVFALDQATKWWAVRSLSDGPVDLVWTLDLRLVRNFGASFSSFDGQGPLISVIVFAVAVTLAVTGRRQERPAVRAAYGLVLGGALGNLADRAFRAGDGGFLRGGVIDFIDFGWWPVFNVADTAVVVGVGLLVLFGLAEPDPTPAADRSS